MATVLKRITALLSNGSFREALALLDQETRRRPGDAALTTRRGYIHHLAGEYEEAVAAYRQAIALDQTMFPTWYALGCAELARDANVEAIRCFRRALSLRPRWPHAELELARALFQMGEVDSAVKHARAAARDPALRREALCYMAVIIPGSGRANNAAVLKARREWSRLEAVTQTPIRRSSQRRSGRLRIGYVSAFFGARNWMKPVWGVVNHHDRSTVEIHLFSDNLQPTIESGYRHDPRDFIHNITHLSNETVAHRVARIGIDVLVDLNSYSFPQRFGLFMRRPAHVAVGWFNAYATTGTQAFDYIVGDDTVIPACEERFYAERVLRVPGSYLAFSVLYPCPDVAPPPCLQSGRLTFGSFCSQYKITHEVIAAWAAILRAAPDAGLILKNRALDDLSNRRSLKRLFSQQGVDPGRILLDGSSEHMAFLAAYERVDIALDTFPYSGGTTTMEAIWQGIPVLTFNGNRWASRTSRSLLLAAGLDDWCMPDLWSYVQRAIVLAQSSEAPAELATLRATMRSHLRSKPVCDCARLARSLEDLYIRIATHERTSRLLHGRPSADRLSDPFGTP